MGAIAKDMCRKYNPEIVNVTIDGMGINKHEGDPMQYGNSTQI